MPVHNGMPYVQEALASVLSQSGSPWSVLLVDDASTDGTWEYVRNFAAPNVRVRRNPMNFGLYGTLHNCLSEITSPWTCLIFQDDRLRHDYLQTMLALAREHPEHPFLWPAINIIDAKGRMLRPGIDSGRVEIFRAGRGSWRDALLRGTYWTISGSLSRTATLQKYGFRADLPHLGDWDLLLRALLHESFLYVERPLCDIREHAGQASCANLSTARDLRERLQVVAEQIGAAPAHVGFRFRTTLAISLLRGIVSRGLQAVHGRQWPIERGNWALAATCLCLLPSVIPAILGRLSRGVDLSVQAPCEV